MSNTEMLNVSFVFAMQGKDEDYKDEDDEEGPSQAEPVVFEGDGNTDLCVLCGVALLRTTCAALGKLQSPFLKGSGCALNALLEEEVQFQFSTQL